MYTLPSFPNEEIKSELLIFGIAPNSDVEEDESLPPKPLTAQGSGSTAQCSIPQKTVADPLNQTHWEQSPWCSHFRSSLTGSHPKAHPLAFSAQLSQNSKPTRKSVEHPASWTAWWHVGAGPCTSLAGLLYMVLPQVQCQGQWKPKALTRPWKAQTYVHLPYTGPSFQKSERLSEFSVQGLGHFISKAT